MKIKYIVTKFISPITRPDIYKVKYVLTRISGNMKNGTPVNINVYEAMILFEKTSKELIKKKEKIAIKNLKNRVNLFIKKASNKRISLPSYKGRFYMLNIKTII